MEEYLKDQLNEFKELKNNNPKIAKKDILHIIDNIEIAKSLSKSNFEVLIKKYTKELFDLKSKLFAESLKITENEKICTKQIEKKKEIWSLMVGLGSKEIKNNFRGSLPAFPDPEMCSDWDYKK